MESMNLSIVQFPPDTAFPGCSIYTFVFEVTGGQSLAKTMMSWLLTATAIGTCFT